MALGDLGDPVSVAEAINRVDKLFLLIGEENVPVELSQALTADGLAKKFGLKHVTYVCEDAFPHSSHSLERRLQNRCRIPFLKLAGQRLDCCEFRIPGLPSRPDPERRYDLHLSSRQEELSQS
jgi:hypothetical protein